MSLNRCEFIGNLGSDPEIVVLSSGKKIAKFSIAVSKKWKNEKGDQQEKTEWINTVCFSKLSEVIHSYLHKGDKVFISGEFTTSTWETDGQKRYKTEINLQELEMLGGNKDNAMPAPQNKPQPGNDESDPLPF